MKQILAMILAGGQGERLSLLSQERAKPAVPFAGKYRIIDFALSNCVNTGIYDVAVLTQYRPRSLNDHIGIGKPWDLDRMSGGVRLLQPYLGSAGSDWYQGTADAVRQNLYYIEERGADLVLILAGDHIYKMNYRGMLTFHEERNADLTVAVTEVPLEEAPRYGVITVGEQDRVVSFVEKPANPEGNLVSMGIYIFARETLVRRLNADAESASAHDFGSDILPAMVKEDKVFAYSFKSYWRDIGTIQSYWEANMDLIARPPLFNLYNSFVIHTKSEERAPATITGSSKIAQSLISHGCIIEGQVEHSVLSPGVRIAEGAVVRDSIVMFDSAIGRNTIIDRCILDKQVTIGENCHLGFGDDYSPNEEEPTMLNAGITLIGKMASIPPGTKIGRNCKVYPGASEGDFTDDFVASGQSVRSEAKRKEFMV